MAPRKPSFVVKACLVRMVNLERAMVTMVLFAGDALGVSSRSRKIGWAVIFVEQPSRDLWDPINYELGDPHLHRPSHGDPPLGLLTFVIGGRVAGSVSVRGQGRAKVLRAKQGNCGPARMFWSLDTSPRSRGGPFGQGSCVMLSWSSR